MPDVVSHMRGAGFSDEEIATSMQDMREHMKAGGFDDTEVDDYLGLPKTPKGIPAAFVERMVTGAKFAAEISGIPKAYAGAWQYGQSIGQEAGQETVEALKGVVKALNPVSDERRAATEALAKGTKPQGLFDEGMQQTGAAALAIMSLPFAPLTGAIHAIAGSPIIAAEHTLREGGAWLHGEEKVQVAEKEAGLTPGGTTKEEANKQIDLALMGIMAKFGGPPIQRISNGPGGVPELQQIGGLPKGEDFSNASTAIGHGDTTPAMEGKLQDLYEQKGIHPAEVAHDAQTDVTITQSMLSVDRADMPAAYVQAYHGSPHDFAAFSSERIGTGEGAQSYGHGLYFAENEGVAQGYQKKLGAASDIPNDVLAEYFKPGEIVNGYGGRDRVIAFDRDTGNVTVQEVGADGQPKSGIDGRVRVHHTMPELKEVNRVFRERGLPEYTAGSLYQVRIHADREAMIDFDKPLSGQNDYVKAALAPLVDAQIAKLEKAARAGVQSPAVRDLLEDFKSGDITVTRMLTHFETDKAKQSQMLSELGIPGIKYLDQGSRRLSDAEIHDEIASIKADAEKAQKFGQRAAPQALGPSDAKAAIARLEAQLGQPETRNFVVFNDKDVEITHKNGEPVTGPERAQAMDILNERQPSSAGAAAVKPPAYSDAQQQVLSKISIDEKAPTAKLTWDKLYTNTMDKLFPLAKAVKASGETLAAEENPYQLARLLSGSAGKADHFLNNGTFDFRSYENNGPAMREILAPVKDDLNGFRAYMASARALELEGRGIKSGFDAGEAPSAPPLISAGLDAPRTVVIEGRDKFAKPLLELVDYQNRVAAYARDAGVISDAGYAAMVKLNQLYVPFSRVMGLDEGTFIRGGGSSLQAKNPVKSITGSARDIIDPLESIIRNTHLMVEMAERNVVGTKLVDMLKRMEGEMPELPKATADVAVKDTARAAAMADEFGAVGVKGADELAAALDHATAPLKEGEIAILRDGKRETYNVDPQLANAMKGLDAQSMSMFERVLAAPASLLRAGAVLTPQFWARHIMRDYLYATATSTQERGLFTPWDMAKGLAGLIVKDADYWNWLKSGGGNASVAGLDRQYLQENLRELTGKTGLAGRAWNVVTDPEASMWQKTASVGTLPFQAIEKFVIDPLRAATQIAENASHLAAFKKGMRAQERAEPEATNLRDQIIRAGWASRDTAVDAARMGASMRAYNQIFAFGNIKLQDTDRVVRAFKDNPITATALIAGAITVPAVTLWGINHDDPDYQELPQWEKDMFFIVPVGTAEPSPLHVAQGQARGVAPTNSAAMFLRLPKPWAMGMVFGSGVERMLEAYKGTNPTPFKEFGKDLYATSGPDFVPTAAAPIIDQFANRSTFTNRTLIPAAQEKFLPEYQYTPYTTELTKELGKIVGAFPGISQLKMDNSGFGGTAKALTSPILMENYVRGWTGTLGMYALQAADKSLRAAGVLPDPPKPAGTLADIPVIQAFVVRYPSANTESVQTFQDDYAKAQSFMTTWQAMAKDGNVQAMQHIQEMADTHMLEQLDGFHQAIGNLNQMVRLVYKNPDIPADEKRQLIDQLYYGIIQTAQGGNHAIHAIREKAADVVSTRH